MSKNVKLAQELVRVTRGLKHLPTETNRHVVAKASLAESTLREAIRKAKKKGGSGAAARSEQGENQAAMS
jgi:hypothetical protein